MRGPGLVYVSSLTYKRPGELATLLPALEGLIHPGGWQVRFLIVDNDPQGSGRAVVDAARAEFGESLAYVIEETPGIPAARNRALKEAMDANATLLCFLDDDETPEPQWLCELISCWATSDAALIGGPVRRRLPEQPLSLKQRLVGRSMIARRAIDARLAASGNKSGRARVYTGNWLGDLSAIRKHDLRFDTSLQFTGGSDMAFYLATQKKGLRTGWCETAVVYETFEAERLTFGFQFARGRAHGIVKAAMTEPSLPKVMRTQLPRAAIGIGLLVIPLLGIGSYSLGLHMIGSAVGHLSYLRGRKSEMYAYGRTA
jgi:glycosyltransferase involved in cell wall biosynthesis